MFDKPFYITEELWNNKLSFKKRGESPKLYVPSLIDATFDDIKLWNEVVFEDFWMTDDNLHSCKWLQNYYRIKWQWKEIILVDNHNTVLYFWYEARQRWLIWNDNELIHIDEHSDLWECEWKLSKENSKDLEKVFYFTNYVCNVWNYIKPALEEWIIKNCHQIRSEYSLNEHKNHQINWNIILNIDLDFWSPWLDFIDYELKKEITIAYAKKAKVITVCTSPFFIDQERALEVFFDLFKN